MIFHVVIPVFNRIQLTTRCLESLLAQTEKGMDIIVIDDGSTDGTSEVIPERFPEVQIIAGDGTLWWSGAVNLGIQQALLSAAPEDYILLVNNDTYFDPIFLARCREAAVKYPKSLVGSVLVDSFTGQKQGGVRINWYTAKHTWLNSGKGIEDFPPGHVEPVSVLTGRGVIVPCSVYCEIGLYEQFYLEQNGDTELSRRANLKGYRLFVNYDMVTYNSDPTDVDRDTFYGPTEIFQYFFGRKSETRLRTRFWFAIKTAANPLQGACFLVCDFVRILMHLLFRLRLGVFLRQS